MTFANYMIVEKRVHKNSEMLQTSEHRDRISCNRDAQTVSVQVRIASCEKSHLSNHVVYHNTAAYID